MVYTDMMSYHVILRGDRKHCQTNQPSALHTGCSFLISKKDSVRKSTEGISQ